MYENTFGVWKAVNSFEDPVRACGRRDEGKKDRSSHDE